MAALTSVGEPTTRPGPLGRLARIGALPTDGHDEALRKQILVLSASLITALAIGWVITYWLLGLRVPALIPFAYQVVSIANLIVFARTKRYRFFRTCELALSLLLPVLLQLALGGFVASSGVILWSFTAPLGALLFAGRREAIPWVVAFVVAMVAAGLLDPLVDSRIASIPSWVTVSFFVGNVLGVTGTAYVLLVYFVAERERYARALVIEQQRSEHLLLNVLPKPIAERLKAGESTIADGFTEVGVLFADIAGFTPMSERMAPDAVVRMLDEIFTEFDELAVRFAVEKIKTIGDAYMVASGLLEPRADHARDIVDMALAMRDAIERHDGLGIRIGIDIGPVVAGVIGRSKFSYDLWGDTVNTASRMESHGVTGQIHVTERAARRLRPRYRLEERGIIEVKGKGSMPTFLVTGRL